MLNSLFRTNSKALTIALANSKLVITGILYSTAFLLISYSSFNIALYFSNTLAVGIFGKASLGLANDGLIYGGGLSQLGIQFTGVLAVLSFVAVSMGIVFKLIDVTIGLRVTREEEFRGLDIGEHGLESYAGFQIID